MNDPQTPTKLIDQLRAWFHPKDRAVVLADNTFIEAPAISTPGTPAAGRRRLYTKSDGWYNLESSGSEYRFSMFEIATTTLGASAASVTFSSIPGIYKHLYLFFNVRTDRASNSDTVNWQANGDGGNNYDHIYNLSLNAAISGATTTAATSAQFARVDAATSTASNFGGGYALWPNYSNASVKKICVAHSVAFGANAAASILLIVTGSGWRSTAAITSITLIPNTGPNFVANSTFSLYGVL